MTDLITLTGLVATTPRHITTSEGLAITSFRLASSQRRYDRVQQRWIDGDTNWYTVSAFRNLAQNAATSVSKGDRVILTGRVRIRDWENTDRSGTTVEVEAESVGPDLTWGTAVYTRTTTTLSTDDSQWVPVDEPETQHESENSSAA
jgi:single-strand DNA-binding protein